ncbi:hypothetical protein D3C84_952700 [compost metagenome]
MPVLNRKAGEAVYGFHQQHVALARIFQQAQQLWPVSGGAAGVLQIHAGDDLIMVAGELLKRGTGAAGVLLFGGGSEVCADEHDVCLYQLGRSTNNVALWVLLIKR